MLLIGSGNRIMDGAHRAALLLADDPERTVEVVRLYGNGAKVLSCQARGNRPIGQTPSSVAVSWLQRIQTRTPTVLFKVSDAFLNELKVGEDVDVLVGSIDAAVAAVREAGGDVSKCKSTDVSGTQVHLDYVQGGKIYVRLDLYQKFSFPGVSERQAPTPDEVFASAVAAESPTGWHYNKTSLEHECRLRWMEWAQWHKQRPDKKKHLKWIEEHNCPPHALKSSENLGLVECRIEVPKGSTIKYEASGTTRTLAKPMIANYGFVPNTIVSAGRQWDGGLYGDGDPLDCIVVGGALQVNTTVRMVLQGVLKMEDHHKFDWKLVGRREDHLPRSDLPRTEWEKLQTWFSTYKTMVNIHGIGSRNDALTLLHASARTKLGEAGGLGSPPNF